MIPQYPPMHERSLPAQQSAVVVHLSPSAEHVGGGPAVAVRAVAAAAVDAALARRAHRRAGRERRERADVAAHELLPGQEERRVARVASAGPFTGSIVRAVAQIFLVSAWKTGSGTALLLHGVHHDVAVLAAAREEHPEVPARRHRAARRVEVQVLVAAPKGRYELPFRKPLARFSACAVPGERRHVM